MMHSSIAMRERGLCSGNPPAHLAVLWWRSLEHGADLVGKRDSRLRMSKGGVIIRRGLCRQADGLLLSVSGLANAEVAWPEAALPAFYMPAVFLSVVRQFPRPASQFARGEAGQLCKAHCPVHW